MDASAFVLRSPGLPTWLGKRRAWTLGVFAAAVLACGCVPASSGAAPAAGVTTFTDPTEHAFTISAPAGWTVTGGVRRASPSAATPWVVETSPDGATSIILGDPSIPSFILPSPRRPTGSSVKNAAGAQSLVEPYEGGVRFAADYAHHVFTPICGALREAGTQGEPTLASTSRSDSERRAAEVGVAPPPTVFDGGSARFTCHTSGGPMAVGVIDVTGLNRSGGGFWTVSVLIAYRTPAARQAEIEQVARAIRLTFRRNPQWEARMVSATQARLGVIQQNGQAAMAALTRQEAQESAALNAQEAAANAQLNAAHAADMAQLNAQGASRDAAFAQHLYNKQTGQESEMRYINNQQCIQWWDAAHTRCRTTAPN